MRRSFIIYNPHQIFADQLKKDETGREFNKYGGEERGYDGFGGETCG